MLNNNVSIGTPTAYSLLHIKGTNPTLKIMAQGATGAMSQLNLSTYDNTINPPNCSLIATDTGSYGATFRRALQEKDRAGGADVTDRNKWQFSHDTFNRNDVENWFLVVKLV
jgi:hypothetical protein